MPNVPKLNTQTSTPRQQSVGRLRINAPIEAFGGGRAAQGMAQLGQGVAALGEGVSEAAAASKKRKEDDDKKKAKIAAVRQSTLLKARNDRIKLSYNTAGANESMALRGKRGVGGTAVVADYDAGTDERIKAATKGIKNPDERAAMVTELLQSDAKRRNTLFTHQNSQTKLVAEQDWAINGQGITESMGTNHSSLSMFGDDVNQWMGQFTEDTLRHALSGRQDALGLTDKQINDNVKQIVDDGSRGAINNLIGDIPNSEFNSPEIETERVKNIIDQFSNLDTAERDKLKKAADSRLKDVQTKQKEVDTKLNRQVLDKFGRDVSKIFDTGSDIDAKIFRDEAKLRDPKNAASYNTIFNTWKKPTPLVKDYELDKRLNDSENIEKYKDQITDEWKAGDISGETWERQMKAADTDIQVSKKAVWDEGLQRMDRIIVGMEDTGAGKGQLKRTGFFPRDIKVEDLKKKWSLYREMVLNEPNVSDKELQQIQDKLFFTPEAKMQAKSLEDRLYEANTLIQRAALRPGTQDLTRKDVGDFNAAKRLSNEEIDKELMDIFSIDESEFKKAMEQ